MSPVVVRQTLAIVLVALLSGCNADKDYGYDTPFSATVPVRWAQSGGVGYTDLRLGENDALWVPEVQPQGHASAEALVFCAARPVKNALNTHCDLERVLGWKDLRAEHSRPTKLCNNRSAEEIAASGYFEGAPAMARAVRTKDSQGQVYLALYVRKLSQPEDPAAVKSIWTICPFRNR